MHPLLLLWDIDGTMLFTKGAGEEALRQTLKNRFGVLDDLGGIEMAGRTDTSIAKDICDRHPTHNLQPNDLLDAYLEVLPECLGQKKGGVFPGVRELLQWSHEHSEVHNALLTGNIKRGAFIKLGHYGLANFFEFGAFGDDSPDRNCLGPVALKRARDILKRDFHIDYTWVIGDTPKDIACARALGCKVLAVATSRYPVAELEKHGADFCVANLSDYKAIIQRLES